MDLLVEAELKRVLAAPGCPICRVVLEENAEEFVKNYVQRGGE